MFLDIVSLVMEVQLIISSSYVRGALFPQILFIFATFLKIRISEYCLKSNIFLHQMASQPASSSSSGRLYMDLKTIAKEYAKTWLPGQHRNTETGVFRAWLAMTDPAEFGDIIERELAEDWLFFLAQRHKNYRCALRFRLVPVTSATGEITIAYF